MHHSSQFVGGCGPNFVHVTSIWHRKLSDLSCIEQLDLHAHSTSFFCIKLKLGVCQKFNTASVVCQLLIN